MNKSVLLQTDNTQKYPGTSLDNKSEYTSQPEQHSKLNGLIYRKLMYSSDPELANLCSEDSLKMKTDSLDEPTSIDASTVTVFGFTKETLPYIVNYFELLGNVDYRWTNSPDTNYIHIKFKDPTYASLALQKNGRKLHNNQIIGVIRYTPSHEIVQETPQKYMPAELIIGHTLITENAARPTVPGHNDDPGMIGRILHRFFQW